MTEQERDSKLVRRVLQGDREAYCELAESYSKPLFSAAYRITGNREDAADATQTALIKGFTELRRFDQSRRFFSWIFRIAVNESLNLVKSRRPGSERLLELCEDSHETDERSLSAEIRRELHLALLELEPNHRVVILLRHLQGLSYREMAAIVGVSEKTVKSRLFEARRRLRKLLVTRGLFE